MMGKILFSLLLLCLIGQVRSQSNTDLGANLNGIGVSPLNRAYVDAMKEAGGFVSLRTGNPSANVDANGWPTEDCWVQIQWIWNGTGHIFNGTYKLSFVGKADLGSWGGATFSNVVYDSAKNTTTADVDVNFPEAVADYTFFTIQFSGTQGGVSKIKLIRPGYPANSTQVFTDTFKNHVKRFSAFRFKDWENTDANTSVNWSDRTPVGWPSYSSRQGVPWEVCIDLCNELHRDPWINVPIAASDDYVLQLARLLKSRLEPGRKVYVEYSNEVWNGSFPQYQTNYDAAVREVEAGGSNLIDSGESLAKDGDGKYVFGYLWAMRRYAKRSLQIRNLFAQVWGEPAMNTTVRPILADQVSWAETFRQALEYVARFYGKPSRFFYAVAGAPYFNIGSLDQRTDLTTQEVLGGLQSCVDTYKDRYQNPSLHRMIAYGAFYGLKAFTYEGGPDTYGANNVPAKKAASLDSQMRAICRQYLNDWYAYGGDRFMWFVAGAGTYDSQYGTWALTNDPDREDVPKVEAMDDVLQAKRPALTAGLATPGVKDARDFVDAAADWATSAPYLQSLPIDAQYDYLLRSPTNGIYNLSVQTSSTTGPWTLGVIANGSNEEVLSLTSTGSVTKFQSSALVPVRLNRGLNVVRLWSHASGKFNVKSVTLARVGDLPAPTGVVATGGSGSVAISWRASSAARGYNVYRSQFADEQPARPLAKLGATSGFVDRSVVKGARYYYRVAAVDSAGPGDLSDEVVATTASK